MKKIVTIVILSIFLFGCNLTPKKNAENRTGNMYNAKWLNDKHNIDGQVQCQKAIPKLGEFAHKWTDGWLDQKFMYYKQIVKEEGVLTLIGNKIQFQNKYGAWVSFKYYCDYDVRTDSVIDYGEY